MARPIRIQYPGAFYHIMTRGNERSNIFKGIEDYQNFLLVFFDVIKRYNWICYAYCLMPNHYHLLIKTNEANLSLGMRQLNGIYTQNFNIRYKRIGHLFHGRFKSILVEEENYKNELIRYIALNPIKSKLVDNIEDWRWNSCLEILGKTQKTGCINTKEILSYFDENEDKAKKIFIDYLKNKVENEEKINDLKGGIILGSNKFIEKIKDYFKKQEKETEIPAKERLISRPSLEEIFHKNITDKKERNKLIYKACMDYSYSLSEVGDFINLHYASVSRIFNEEKRKMLK